MDKVLALASCIWVTYTCMSFRCYLTPDYCRIFPMDAQGQPQQPGPALLKATDLFSPQLIGLQQGRDQQACAVAHHLNQENLILKKACHCPGLPSPSLHLEMDVRVCILRSASATSQLEK